MIRIRALRAALTILLASSAGVALGRWQPYPCFGSAEILDMGFSWPGPRGEATSRLRCENELLPSALNPCIFARERKMMASTNGGATWFGAGYQCLGYQLNCAVGPAILYDWLNCSGHTLAHDAHRYRFVVWHGGCSRIGEVPPLEEDEVEF